MEACKKFVRKYGAQAALFAGFSVAMVESALAEVPAAVTSAITEGAADAVTVATAMLVAIIALVAFKLMRRGAH